MQAANHDATMVRAKELGARLLFFDFYPSFFCFVLFFYVIYKFACFEGHNALSVQSISTCHAHGNQVKKQITGYCSATRHVLNWSHTQTMKSCHSDTKTKKVVKEKSGSPCSHSQKISHCDFSIII